MNAEFSDYVGCDHMFVTTTNAQSDLYCIDLSDVIAVAVGGSVTGVSGGSISRYRGRERADSRALASSTLICKARTLLVHRYVVPIGKVLGCLGCCG